MFNGVFKVELLKWDFVTRGFWVMKLQHLALGARFEYEGQVFTKTGPMTATSGASGQRVIPRYALLKPADVPSPEQESSIGGRVGKPVVVAAFNEFFSHCCGLVEDRHVAELEEARSRFLAALR